MKKYGIIGFPLGHTMSPSLHNWGFAAHGIDAVYKAWPTAPDELESFAARFRSESFGGLSVTIPHKQAIIPFVDELTDRARSVGAVNTLWWDGEMLMGDNTDVAGVVNPIKSRGLEPESALILGAGGASRAAVAACRELGIKEIIITNRTRSKAETIGADFGIQVMDWDRRHEASPQLVINSTPLGMAGDLVDSSPWEADMAAINTVFDLVYNPLETRLLRLARQQGCRAIEGVEMFIHQGLEQFRLWTGKALDPEGAEQLILKELGK